MGNTQGKPKLGGSRENKVLFTHMKFNLEEEYLSIFKKVYIGYMENSGMYYNIHEVFNKEGYFSIKATYLGANMCLL